jgi:hypothetical protein
MARARNVKPAFFLHEILAGLAAWVRLLFIGLWTIADRAGRLPDRPKRIHAALFPYEPDLDIDGGLNHLAENGFIDRYQDGGGRFIQIANWAKHQRPHHQEPESEIPAPPENRTTSDATPKELRTTSEIGRSASEIRRTTSCHNPNRPQLIEAHNVGETSENLRTNTEVLRPISDSIRLQPSTFNLQPATSNSQPERADAQQPDNGLQEFLAAYPKKTKTDPAARAYVSIIGTDLEHQELMAGLSRWLNSDQWRRSLQADGGRYLPDPDKFIFERRYIEYPEPYRDTGQDDGADAVGAAMEILKREREAA